MGLFDRDKSKTTPDFTRDKPANKEKADFSKVRSGASSTAPEAPAQGGQTYTVEKGDTLWAISQRFYGEGNQWPRIHEANRGLIEDPDVIQIGWVLAIPPRVAEGGSQ